MINMSLKKLGLLVAALVAAPSIVCAITLPPSVPDSGSTLGLLAISAAIVVVARRWFDSRRR